MTGVVHVVHCIDTEGPLYESMDATFSRLNDIFGLELEPSASLMKRLQAGEVDLGGIEAAVQRVVDPHLLSYNDTWGKVDALFTDCATEQFRRGLPDSTGNGWVYNWFCVDHVDYESNPRRRDVGYHNVFDHYVALIREAGAERDGLHFHYHPHNFRHEAHRSATHWWATSNSLQQVISRRVIDREWFPSANRAGFHAIRPDSHWFLEQYIPFDFSSQATVPSDEDAAQSGLETGRWGDWRRAPITWEPFHPDHDDYQVPGSCRRWTARCLNVGTRYRLLGEDDVRQAFLEARDGKPVVMAFTNHDFRDMRPDIGSVQEMLKAVGADFPDVAFRYSEAVHAMRQALGLRAQRPCEFRAFIRAIGESSHALEVVSETPTFGPQPWLALRTVAGTYHHDNFDIEKPFHSWRYVFDDETFPLPALSGIGIAANNAYGAATILSIDPRTGRMSSRFWNDPKEIG